MAKHTDKYDDKNLITLAKSKYDDQQRSTLPSEIVYLPSGGKIYPKDSVLRDGKIEMRYMTAYDEDILTNPSYMKDGVILNKLLEALIVTDINVGDISESDKESLIISARILGYGAEYPVKIQDPKTKKNLDRVVDLRNLKYKPFELETNDNGEMKYKTEAGTTIYFSFISSKESEDTNVNKVSDILKKVIKQVDDTRDSEAIEEFIKFKFLAKDAKQFREYVANNSPGLDLNYEFEGEDGSAFSTMFPLGADLFWF